MLTRREAVSRSAKLALALGSQGWLPQVAQAAWNTAAFDAKTLPDLSKALGVSAPAASKDVTVSGPDIAENGAVVQVGVATALPGVKRLLILVEKNPALMSAAFDVTEFVEASFTTRVKMGQSSNVMAVAVMNDGRVLYAQKEIKVTLGGCGG